MADYIYVIGSGVIVPDTSNTLAQVQAEYRAVFGSDLSVDPETPQGMLMAMDTDARDATVRGIAAAANQINPNIASGVWLDAIWGLTGGTRRYATRSRIEGVDLIGVAGTIIPAGSVAVVAPTSAPFQLAGDVVLDSNGNGVGTFISVEYGPIEAPANTLTGIATQVLGWEGVNNPNAAQLGQLTETDLASRQRRRETLALQSTGLLQSLSSGLMDTDGVRSCVVRENVEDTPQTIDGVLMAAHSVYACVDGGTDADVARTLLDRKSLGASWNGDTVVAVVEPFSGQTYSVKFDRPDLVNVFARVEIAAGSALSDPANAVRNAIVDYASGDLADERGLVVGQDVSAFELAGAVNRQHPQIYVKALTIGTSPGALSPASIAIGITQRAQLVPGNIVVEIV